MTIPSPAASVEVIETTNGTDNSSYVDWPAIFGGIVLASAISIVLLTFGSAIGLSFTSFNAREGVDPLWVGIAAATWLLWVLLSSFMAGGYLTGRLRRRHFDARPHEVAVRDGAHGLLVWGGSLVLGAVLAVSGVGALANTVGSIASTATLASATAAGDVAEAADGFDPTAYFTDVLFRPAPAGTEEAPVAETPAPATPAAPATPVAPADDADADAPAAPVTTPAPAATTPAPVAPVATTTTVDTTALRDEAGRILARSAVEGEFSETDRVYLAQVIATNTGLTQEEAEARVDEVVANIDAAAAQAVEAAETARRTSVVAAFLTAAALLAAAIGAYWAASMGGRHRDEGTEFADVFRRY
ncbi:hypothetical protein EMQ25_12395 [Arsenicitalea aurantiaca]|uniref:Uncharacterized protein n=1 Tax=Arsenicitalea aurantiaca TaxID=1783274 RepID=A0A433X7V0_9HYPH|nr:hypothetical protein [Arsenicitalea aurantiaca]RUT30118.1 hypothetical protein EMQ25_12395 [Arsenicitalea aurantiaca]